MPSSKLSNSSVSQIVQLSDAGKSDREIAQSLNLKRLQVAAIIARFRLKDQPRAEPSVSESAATGEAMGSEPAEQDVVTEATVEGPAEEAESEDGLYVGDDSEYGDPLYWVPWNTRLAQNPHLMIIGESGSGKTYATQCLVAELAQADLPSVIFDYSQGFEQETLDRQFRKFTKPEEYFIGEKGLAINPVEIFPRDVKGPNSVATRISDVFDAVYHLV